MRKEAENKAGDREENQGTMSTKPREESLEKSKGFIVSTTVTIVLATTRTRSILKESSFKLHSGLVQPHITR